MTDPSTGFGEFNGDALQAMWAVIHAQNKHISTALNRCGIVSIDIPDDSIHATPSRLPGPEEKRILGDSQSESDTLVQVSTRHRSPSTHPVGASDVDDPEDIENSPARVAHHSSSQAVIPIISTLRQGTANSRIPLSPELDQPDDEVDHEYLGILRSTVTLARRAVLPSQDTIDMTAPARSLHAEEDSDDREEDSDNSEEGSDNPEDDLDLSPSEKIERDKKIGAAGESFVSIFRPRSYREF